MTNEEYKITMGIALEMKASGKTKVYAVTPIAMEGPSEGFTVDDPSTQSHTAPYAIVSPLQPTYKEDEEKEKVFEEESTTPRKSHRLSKI